MSEIIKDNEPVKAAMTDEEIHQWIEACNHEPARETLRHYLTLRSNNLSDLPKAETETLRACEDWKATFEIMSIRRVNNTAEAWRSSQRVVDDLLGRGLLEFGEPNTTYRITDAGRSALSAQVQDVARCRDCDGYNCDDGCAYPDAEPNQPKDAE